MTGFSRVVRRNLVGWSLVLLGIVLSLPLVPGQGILTILLGLAIADWPGKQRFFRWIRSFHWFGRLDDVLHAKLGWRLPEHEHQAKPPSSPADS